jgi:hypothetical protein
MKGSLTINVFVSEILQSQADDLIGRCHDLLRINVAAKSIPRIPPEGRQSSLVEQVN